MSQKIIVALNKSENACVASNTPCTDIIKHVTCSNNFCYKIYPSCSYYISTVSTKLCLVTCGFLEN